MPSRCNGIPGQPCSEFAVALRIRPFAITERAFKRLSESEQQIVTEELTAGVKAVDQVSRQDNDKAAAALTKQGIVWLDPKPEEADEWFTLAAKRTPS